MISGFYGIADKEHSLKAYGPILRGNVLATFRRKILPVFRIILELEIPPVLLRID